MSQLRLLHQLLRSEYAASQHICWIDDASGKIVNDVTWTLHLIVAAAQGLQRGDETGWRTLVMYCVERAMSPHLIQAIGAYLEPYGQLPPLSLIDLSETPYRNWRGTAVPLLDETDHTDLHAAAYRPEPDRVLHLKDPQAWSLYPPRLHDEHPCPQTQTVHKSQHWLFA